MLRPIEVLIANIIVFFHSFLTNLGWNDDWFVGAWPMAVIFLTLFVRVCLLPLFIKQMHQMRATSAIQPHVAKIQNKYKDKKDHASKDAMNKELMALYAEHNTNPLSSCLPILIQMPIFLALFSTLRALGEIAEGTKEAIGPLNQQIAQLMNKSEFFGPVMSETFNSAAQGSNVKIVIGIIVAVMCGTMVIQQIMLMKFNTPVESFGTQQHNMQKTMIVVFPIMYIFSSVVLPVGVLIYWVTSNIWGLVQSGFQLVYMPTPGSVAYTEKAKWDQAKRDKNPEKYAAQDAAKAKKENDARLQRKAAHAGVTVQEIIEQEAAEAEETAGKSNQRKQPTSKKRSKK
jgi:YidC/Oxa1 family membrane protein insertase